MKMRFAYAGFDLMAPALTALMGDNELIKLFTCAVDGIAETNTEVIASARSAGAPYTLERITQGDIEELLDNGCELLISAGYYYRIPVDERLPMVNIHPSLLPYGRGAWPMPLAILDGLKESGVTVHKTEESFDSGDILMQESFELADDETLMSFMDKVNAMLPDMMRRLTADFDSLWRGARPQGEGEYQPEPDPHDYAFTREDDCEHADRVLRAFYGFECFYSDGAGICPLRFGRAVKGDNTAKEWPISDGFIEISSV